MERKIQNNLLKQGKFKKIMYMQKLHTFQTLTMLVAQSPPS